MELLRNSKVRTGIFYDNSAFYLDFIVLQDKKARKLTKKRVSQSIFWHVLRFSVRCLMKMYYIQLGTLLRSKRKLEELGTIIQESRRAGH